MNPQVSIVMGVYNGEKYLREAVESILGQTLVNFEFIIINDGSTDSSGSILEQYQDPRIVLVHQANAGLTRTLNTGMAMAKGAYIARQDADDFSLPDRLKEQVAFLEANESIALVGSAVQVVDGEGSHLTVFNPPCDSAVICDRLKQSNCFWHGSVMFRRSCVAALQGYNESFSSAQDYDLWLRFSEKYQLANLATPLYGYRFNPDSITFKKIVVQRRLAELAKILAELRSQGLDQDETLKRFEASLKLPLTTDEKIDIVKSYKPWCRLLLKREKYPAARLLMSAIFKHHPSLLFRLRFAIGKRFFSPSQLARILENA